MTRREHDFLKFFLRIGGGAALLAVYAVVMPYEDMDGAHQWLGLGDLPDAPIMGYLARSTSFFYAFLGGLMWVLSFDLNRYRPVVCFLGWALISLGLTLFIVDIVEGLPLYWISIEGPTDTLSGCIILYFGRQLEE